MKKRNFIFAVACLSICLGGFPGTASAFWPFGKKKKAGTTGRRRSRKPKTAGEPAATGAEDTSAAAGETASAEAPAETAAAPAEEAKNDGKKKEEVNTLA